MTQEGHAKALGSKDKRKTWAHGAFLSTSWSFSLYFRIRVAHESMGRSFGPDPILQMNSVRRQVLIGEKSIQLRIITGLDTSTLKSKHLKVGSVESTNRLSLLGDACNTIQEPQSIGLLSM
ncbi:hypothetical protein V2G26_021013 [Clonostachys chloroleuca]